MRCGWGNSLPTGDSLPCRPSSQTGQGVGRRNHWYHCRPSHLWSKDLWGTLGWGGMIGHLHRALSLLGAALLLAACAGSAALESQTKQRDARSARLYFLREKGLVGAMGGTAATA